MASESKQADLSIISSAIECHGGYIISIVSRQVVDKQVQLGAGHFQVSGQLLQNHKYAHFQRPSLDLYTHISGVYPNTVLQASWQCFPRGLS